MPAGFLWRWGHLRGLWTREVPLPRWLDAGWKWWGNPSLTFPWWCFIFAPPSLSSFLPLLPEPSCASWSLRVPFLSAIFYQIIIQYMRIVIKHEKSMKTVKKWSENASFSSIITIWWCHVIVNMHLKGTKQQNMSVVFHVIFFIYATSSWFIRELFRLSASSSPLGPLHLSYRLTYFTIVPFSLFCPSPRRRPLRTCSVLTSPICVHSLSASLPLLTPAI